MVEKEGFRPDFVVICEPTSLDVYRGHRGRVELKITTTGTSAHAAHPDKGDNAIYKMARTVLNIEKLTTTFKDDPFLGKGTAVVSIIESKAPSINSVPYESTIYIDRRITVGETKETVLAEFRSVVDAVRCAIEIQDALKTRNESLPEPKRMHFRIGITHCAPDRRSIPHAGLRDKARRRVHWPPHRARGPRDRPTPTAWRI